jgi:hypothetical protein
MPELANSLFRHFLYKPAVALFLENIAAAL